MCLSKDVTGHCSSTPLLYQVPSFNLNTLIPLVITASFLDFSLFHTVCLSKDVTGRCSFHRNFWLHSVSVQRRDRYSVAYSTHLLSVLYLRIPFPPFCLLGFSYFLWEPIEVTPLFTLSFLISVLSPSFTGLSVQRRGRYSPPPLSHLE